MKKMYCETCFTENICHICVYYDKHGYYYYCILYVSSTELYVVNV